MVTIGIINLHLAIQHISTVFISYSLNTTYVIGCSVESEFELVYKPVTHLCRCLISY